MQGTAKRKHGTMILLVGLLLMGIGCALVWEYSTAKQEIAITCGTDVVKKEIKQLKEDLNQKIAEQTDRVNQRLDFIAGWREPRYK